jgi:DNA polymerase III alpha subunit
LEALIKAGGLDSYGTRAAQLLALDEVLEQAHKNSKLVSSGQVSLFGEEDSMTLNHKLPDIEELELDKLLIFEKDLLGFYLHEPPYLGRLKQLEEAIKVRVSGLPDFSVGSRVTFGGVIIETKKVFTKKSGAEMAFVKISDGSGEIECVVFPKTYALSKTILNKEEVVVISGKLDKREEEYSVLIDNVEIFDADEYVVLDIDDSSRPGVIEDRRGYEESQNIPGSAPSLETSLQPEIRNVPQRSEAGSQSGIEIEIPRNAGSDLMKQVNLELKKYPGEKPIVVLIPSNGSLRRLDLPFKIEPDTELLKTLEVLLGPNAVRTG